ncbi:MAG: SMEK domain-containing protein, partial [Ignavibacteriae bacterium]|nr:SMEK domain-containing protein [Ignavibacteriota bacterium]
MNMTREEYLKQISNKLAIWQADIKLRGEINLYDSHIIAEYYVKELFNMFFGYDLENLNDSSKNFPGIDLGDQTQGVAVQVTATKTRAKIQGTLDKFIENKLYKDYPHLYIFILSEKQNSYKPFDTKGLFSFDIDKQILDIGDLIRLA